MSPQFCHVTTTVSAEPGKPLALAGAKRVTSIAISRLTGARAKTVAVMLINPDDWADSPDTIADQLCLDLAVIAAGTVARQAQPEDR